LKENATYLPTVPHPTCRKSYVNILHVPLEFLHFVETKLTITIIKYYNIRKLYIAEFNGLLIAKLKYHIIMLMNARQIIPVIASP